MSGVTPSDARSLFPARVRWLVLGVCMGLSLHAAPPPEWEPGLDVGTWESVIRNQSNRLAAEGKQLEAFQQLLLCPGAECEAAALARSEKEAQAMLKVMNVRGARKHLVAAELYRRMGRKKEALAEHRLAIQGLSPDGRLSWQDGVIPWGFHPMEPMGESSPSGQCFVRPSHDEVDLWIKRFTEAGAWEDAEKAYERIWAWHRGLLKPYAVRDGRRSDNEVLAQQPYGFSPEAMRFALKYANFLFEQGKAEAAYELLLEPAMAMDMDRIAPTRWEATAEQIAALPLRRFASWSSLTPVPVGFPARRDYLDALHDLLQKMGQLQDARKRVAEAPVDPEGRMLRVQAEWKRREGDIPAALALEEAYLQLRKFDAHSTLLRRAWVREVLGMEKEAMAFYEELLNVPPEERSAPGFVGNLFIAARAPMPDFGKLDVSYRADGVYEIVELVRDVPDREGWRSPVPPQPPEGHPSYPRFPVQPGWRIDSFDRLGAYYEKVGDNEAVLRNRLRQLEGPWGIVGYRQLIHCRQEFLSAHQEQAFLDWAADRVPTARPAMSRAQLLLFLCRPDEAMDVLEKYWTSLTAPLPLYTAHDLKSWLEIVDLRDGERKWRFAEILLKLTPEVPKLALFGLNHRQAPDDARLIVSLEAVLNPEHITLFHHAEGKSLGSPSLVKGNPVELAARLRRLYLAEGWAGAAKTLNDRVQRREPPFDSTAYKNSEDREKMDAALAAW